MYFNRRRNRTDGTVKKGLQECGQCKREIPQNPMKRMLEPFLYGNRVYGFSVI